VTFGVVTRIRAVAPAAPRVTRTVAGADTAATGSGSGPSAACAVEPPAGDRTTPARTARPRAPAARAFTSRYRRRDSVWMSSASLCLFAASSIGPDRSAEATEMSSSPSATYSSWVVDAARSMGFARWDGTNPPGRMSSARRAPFVVFSFTVTPRCPAPLIGAVT
jgi:hypothetical protein